MTRFRPVAGAPGEVVVRSTGGTAAPAFSRARPRKSSQEEREQSAPRLLARAQFAMNARSTSPRAWKSSGARATVRTMQGVVWRSIVGLGVLGLAAPACREQKSEPAQEAARAASLPAAASVVAHTGLQSVVRVGDESASGQLLSGFFNLEAGSWRWTAPAFSVKLAVPPGAAQKGAKLILDLALPDQLMAKNPNLSVKVTVKDATTSKTFSHPGEQELELDVPAAAMSGDSVVAEFAVDKPFIPGGADGRTLGVVAKSVELSSM